MQKDVEERDGREGKKSEADTAKEGGGADEEGRLF